MFPAASETSDAENYLIGLIKASGKGRNYELIEYINDINHEYVEWLVWKRGYGVYRLQRIGDAEQQVHAYDLMNRLTSVTDAQGRTEQMTYDIAGRLTSFTSNSGNTITYAYVALGERAAAYVYGFGKTENRSLLCRSI